MRIVFPLDCFVLEYLNVFDFFVNNHDKKMTTKKTDGLSA